jgi:prepilin-type processing-associated H-X9-DG protein
VLPFLEQGSLEQSIDYQRPVSHPVNQPAISTVVSAYVCPSTPKLPRFESSGNRHVIQGLFSDGGKHPSLVWRPELKAARYDYEELQILNFRPTNPSNPINDVFWSAWGVWHERDEKGSERRCEPRRWADIDDGLSNTLLVGERAGLPDQFLRDRDIDSAWVEGEALSGRWALQSLASMEGCDDVGFVRNDLPRFYVNRYNLAGLFAFHVGGANVLLCDGSVHLLNENVSEDVFKALFVPDDGAPVSPRDWQ